MPTGGHLRFTVLQELPGRCSLGWHRVALPGTAAAMLLSPQPWVTAHAGLPNLHSLTLEAERKQQEMLQEANYKETHHSCQPIKCAYRKPKASFKII